MIEAALSLWNTGHFSEMRTFFSRPFLKIRRVGLGPDFFSKAWNFSGLSSWVPFTDNIMSPGRRRDRDGPFLFTFVTTKPFLLGFDQSNPCATATLIPSTLLSFCVSSRKFLCAKSFSVGRFPSNTLFFSFLDFRRMDITMLSPAR